MAKICPKCGYEALDYDSINEEYRCILRECNYRQESKIELEKEQLIEK